MGRILNCESGLAPVCSITFALLTILFVGSTQAQLPRSFSYQGTLLNSAGDPAEGFHVARITIYDGQRGHPILTLKSITFKVSNGQFAIEVDSLPDFNWIEGDILIGIAIDGGTELSPRTPLLTAPRALYTQRSARVTVYDSLATTHNLFTHYLGEHWGGGIIYSLYKDSNGVERGLVVNASDLDQPRNWSNVADTSAGAGSTMDGERNSLAIVAQANHSSSAARTCLNFLSDDQTGKYSDWYLPSVEELRLLLAQAYIVNMRRQSGPLASEFYWSSTESGNGVDAFQVDVRTGGAVAKPKSGSINLAGVRAIRRF